MNNPGDYERELEAALRTLNSVKAPEDLVDRVQHRLEHLHTRRHRRRITNWRPILLTPLAFAVVVLTCVTVARQAPWRQVAPQAVRTQAPSRTVIIRDSATALPSRPGGRRALPAQALPAITAKDQPTVPFVYPQSREAQLRLQSASQARITDRAVFDPRSDVENVAADAPK
jgi:hypothetical protein